MMGGSSVAQGRGGPQSQVPLQPNLRNQVPPPILPSQVEHASMISSLRWCRRVEFCPRICFDPWPSLFFVLFHLGSSIPVEVPWRQRGFEPSARPPASGRAQAALPVQPAESTQSDQPVTGKVVGGLNAPFLLSVFVLFLKRRLDRFLSLIFNGIS